MRREAIPANDELLYRRRREEKWLVSSESGRVIEERVSAALPLFRYAGANESHVCSLYLDHEDGELAEAARFSPDDCVKLRVRSYLSPDGTGDRVVLEVKERKAGVTSKYRASVNAASLASLCAGDFDAVDPLLLSKSQRALLVGRVLRPSVFVTYRRRVYQGDPNLRVTFDRDVSWHGPPDDVAQAVALVTLGQLPTPRGGLGQIVVEAKQSSGVQPPFLARALGGETPTTTFSKFIAALGSDPSVGPFVLQGA